MKIAKSLLILTLPCALAACGDLNSMFGSSEDTNANYYQHKSNNDTTVKQTNVVHKDNKQDGAEETGVSAANNTVHNVSATPAQTMTTTTTTHAAPSDGVPNMAPTVGQ